MGQIEARGRDRARGAPSAHVWARATSAIAMRSTAERKRSMATVGAGCLQGEQATKRSGSRRGHVLERLDSRRAPLGCTPRRTQLGDFMSPPRAHTAHHARRAHRNHPVTPPPPTRGGARGRPSAGRTKAPAPRAPRGRSRRRAWHPPLDPHRHSHNRAQTSAHTSTHALTSKHAPGTRPRQRMRPRARPRPRPRAGQLWSSLQRNCL